jgi:hypothetical protein
LHKLGPLSDPLQLSFPVDLDPVDTPAKFNIPVILHFFRLPHFPLRELLEMSAPLADDMTVRIRFNFSNVRDYHATIEPAKFVDDTMDVPRLKDLVHLKAFLAKSLDLGLGNTTLEFCTFTVYCPPQFGVNMKDKQTFADVYLTSSHCSIFMLTYFAA